jgi:hypothetical protein
MMIWRMTKQSEGMMLKQVSGGVVTRKKVCQVTSPLKQFAQYVGLWSRSPPP